MHFTYIFDVDGVCIETPRELDGTVSDPKFWETYWQNRQLQKDNLNVETLCMASALLDAGYYVIFLTARPSKFAEITAEILQHGLRVFGDFKGEVVPLWVNDNPIKTVLGGDVGLMCWDNHDQDWSGSSGYKINMIQHWERSFDVVVANIIEDYKPNAEAFRRHWPVLLWERVKPIEHTL